MAIVCGLSLNISLSSANAFGFTLGPARLIATMTIIENIKAYGIGLDGLTNIRGRVGQCCRRGANYAAASVRDTPSN